MEKHIELDRENTLVNLLRKYQIDLEDPQELFRIDNLMIREVLEAHKKIVTTVDDFTRLRNYISKVQTEYKNDVHSDFKEYPHKVFVNAVLLDEKIACWKICDRKWTKGNFVMFQQPQIVLKNLGKLNLRIVSRSYIVNNPEEHSKAFNEDAAEFYRQWEIHPEADMPFKPY